MDILPEPCLSNPIWQPSSMIVVSCVWSSVWGNDPRPHLSSQTDPCMRSDRRWRVDMQYNSMICYTTLHYTVLYCTISYSTLLYSTLSYYTSIISSVSFAKVGKLNGTIAEYKALRHCCHYCCYDCCYVYYQQQLQYSYQYYYHCYQHYCYDNHYQCYYLFGHPMPPHEGGVGAGSSGGRRLTSIASLSICVVIIIISFMIIIIYIYIYMYLFIQVYYLG